MSDSRELVDPKTGELVTYEPAAHEGAAVGNMAGALQKAGTLDLADKEKEILWAPVEEKDVLVRPDGQVYLPWYWYQKRLRDAFGLSWAMVPATEYPRYIPEQGLLAWGFYLVVRGAYVAYAVGEHEYKASARISYTEAFESCKSNALMRCCKQIGVSTDYLWDSAWDNAWLEKWTYTKTQTWTDRDGKKRTKKKYFKLQNPKEPKPVVEQQDFRDTVSGNRELIKDIEEKFAHKNFEGEIKWKGSMLDLTSFKTNYDLEMLNEKELVNLRKNVFLMLEKALERDSDLGALGDEDESDDEKEKADTA